MSKTTLNAEWWQTVFDEKYLTTYVDVLTPERTQMQVDLVLKLLKPKKTADILDLACGHGRHTFELEKRGYRLTGFDYSKHFINMARSEKKRVESQARFVRGDMRSLPFVSEFDVVISLFTSFGYFEDERDHAQVLRRVARSLKSGGKFLLDLNNPTHLLSQVLKKGTIEKNTGFLTSDEEERLSNGITLRTRHRFDSTRMRWAMTRTWGENGKTKKYHTDLRMFSYPELIHLMEENGLHVERVWGDLTGSLYGCESRRMVILARRK